MRENEFEKQVREKMEQLGFAPSDSVWAGVDKEINKEKKRRVPLFWLFFVSGLLLAGGAYYIIENRNSIHTIAIKQPSTANHQPPTANHQPPTALPSEALAKEGQLSTANRQPPTVNRQPPTVNHVGQSKSSGSGRIKSRSVPLKRTKAKNGSGLDAGAAVAGDIVINNYSNKSVKTETENADKKILDSTAGKAIPVAAENKSKKDSVTGSVAAKKQEQKTNSSRWKIGYTVSAGSSNLNQDLFNSVKTLSPVTNSAAPTPPGANGGPAYYSSSPIRAGFSFVAGAFVNKDLSKRFSFSAGINYHYYSTRINTGGKINPNILSSYGPFSSGSGNNYYQNGNSQSYTNQYHFIEIPLSVNFQLNKSKRNSFIWELGLTPGYIVSSNALYYNPNTNIYSNKYLEPNKMQLNGVTALMIGFPLRKGELQLGPQLQYGFTGFINSNDGNPGHLFYCGLKISFIPGKK